MTELKEISTGMKANESFDFNLERARDLVALVGFETAKEKLESMKVYRWVNHDQTFEYCGCVICDILHQITHDHDSQGNPEIEEVIGVDQYGRSLAVDPYGVVWVGEADPLTKANKWDIADRQTQENREMIRAFGEDVLY